MMFWVWTTAVLVSVCVLAAAAATIPGFDVRSFNPGAEEGDFDDTED